MATAKNRKGSKRGTLKSNKGKGIIRPLTFAQIFKQKWSFTALIPKVTKTTYSGPLPRRSKRPHVKP